MTRSEYKKAMQLIRTNGNYALRWLSAEQKAVIQSLQSGKDKLAERAAIVAYCKREGYEYSFYNLMCNSLQLKLVGLAINAVLGSN